MKRITLTLLAAFALFLSTQSIAQTQKDWTLMIYLVGADLESKSNAGTTDIAEMLAATSTQYVNVVVLTGGANKAGWRTPKTYLINNGVQTELSFVPTHTDMANSENVTQFIDWVTTHYPATSYMLDFWNHGGDIRGFGNDEISKKNQTVPKITQAIAASSFITSGKFFEVIGFDACLMGTIEVISSLKDFTYYYVGSEETEPGHGWNYTPIINYMNADTVYTGDLLGTVIVDSYRQHAIENGTQGEGVTLAAVDMDKIPALETALDSLFAKINRNNLSRKLQQARGQAEEYSKSIKTPIYSEDMVDIGDLMKRLKIVEPSLAVEADAVLNAVLAAVVHKTKDNGRPQSNGISMYLPHNVLVSAGETDYVVYDVYDPIAFSPSIKTYVKDVYVPNAQADNKPPTGKSVSLTYTSTRNGGSRSDSTKIAAINVTHDDDLEQIQVVLIEEFEGYPNEYILLGSTYPDTAWDNTDGSVTYGYTWDESWLSINGFSAYISDIQYFESFDEMGNEMNFTRVQIPAILNPGDSLETDIIISYTYDDEFNITLESIVPEVSVEDSVSLVPRARLRLVPGDRVQLLYESFNEITDEEFFVVDDEAIFTIENGNEDLVLDYDLLPDGNYHLGFVLVDHSQNDTLIFDEKVFVAGESAVKETFAASNITMYPNPSNEILTIDYPEFSGKQYTVRLFDQKGRMVFNNKYDNQKATIKTAQLASGFYRVELRTADAIFVDKLIIKH